MSVLGTIMFTRGSIIGLSTSSLIPKSVRTVVSFSPANNKKCLGFASGTPNHTLTLINGCNTQFTRNTSESASLAKAMQDAAKPLVICGPSGCGKSTIVNKISEEFPDCFGLCCSHTTRKPRESEVDGQNYYFVAKDEFLDAKERGEFIETAEFAGNFYGTSRGAINRVQRAGLICVLDIEMHGVHQIKKTPGLNPHYVFIKPPSLEALEVRLRDRKTETEESLQKRLAKAVEEMEYGSKAENFDLVITNDTIDNAVSELRDFMIVHIEELKRFRKLLSRK